MKLMKPVPGSAKRPADEYFEQNGGRNCEADVQDRMTIGNGADGLSCIIRRAHTNGDAWVLFPALRVLQAGDLCTKQPPIMDANNGGSGVDYPETLAKCVRDHQERRHDHQRPPAGTDDHPIEGIRGSR
jgi:hypothetical protein